MIRMLRILLFMLAIACSVTTQAQSFDSILQKLDSQYPQEKIHVQLDKAAYNAGETIWLKAYLMSAYTLSNISKNIYTELINEKGEIVQRKVTPVVVSGAAASFELPTTLQDSVLFLRAYTRWMLNFDSAFLYVKSIPILTGKKAGNKKQATIQPDIISFFPEGGDMITGLESTIAFKATDSRGLPVKTSGNILNSKGDKLLSFSSRHDGMGTFLLKPQPGEQYTAVWQDHYGKQQKKQLPAPRDKGIILDAIHRPDGIQYGLKRREDAADQAGLYYVVAQMQQQLVYMAKVNLSKSATVTAVIPTENLPTGIVQMTIFNEQQQPLAERIMFINKQDYYFITDLNVQVKGTEKRAKNVIQMDVPDSIICNLSIAITDAGVNPVTRGENDIYSQILLTSDIKGYVHDPGYYFSSEADSVKEHLDLVMLTNGWRRFRWEDVLAGRFPVIRNQPEDYLTLEGTIAGLSKTELIDRELSGILSLKNGGQQALIIPVGRDGHFTLPGLFYYDTARVFYQFTNDKNKVLTSKAVIDMKNNFLKKGPDFSKDEQPPLIFPLQDQATLDKNLQSAQKNIDQKESQRKVQTLEGVVVKAKQKSREEKMDEEYSSGMFRGGNGYTFITEGDPSANGAMTVLTYLQGKVPGLQISVFGTRATLAWRGGSPTLFVNEMQSDVQMIQNTPMSDVAMIKVFRPPFFGASGGGAGGAIAVYTKKGGSSNENVKGLDFAKIPGYTPDREFFAPDYSTPSPDHDQEDVRTTLYWNPFIMTDKNNRRQFFTFYNNDITKKIRVVIEGINAEGKLTRMERVY
jgi:hypothetical protein